MEIRPGVPDNSPSPKPVANLPSQTATERLWRSYGVINEWIRFADAKAGALLTFNGVAIGAALSALKDQHAFFVKQPLIFITGSGFGISLLLSAICALECIKPRVRLRLDAEWPDDRRLDFLYQWWERMKNKQRRHEAPELPNVPQQEAGRRASQIFFEEIARHESVAEFREAVLQTETEVGQAFNDISKQVHAVSKVASIKHQWIARSVFLLHIAVFFGVLLLLALWQLPIEGKS
ncbi:MAG TPA: Pycsar system effector family protein [Abditibacteriaceae bacterium]|jgi:hypothetical protein